MVLFWSGSAVIKTPWGFCNPSGNNSRLKKKFKTFFSHSEKSVLSFFSKLGNVFLGHDPGSRLLATMVEICAFPNAGGGGVSTGWTTRHTASEVFCDETFHHVISCLQEWNACPRAQMPRTAPECVQGAEQVRTWGFTARPPEEQGRPGPLTERSGRWIRSSGVSGSWARRISDF